MRPRVWMLSLLVAASAVALGLHAMSRRAAHFRALSQQHRYQERTATKAAVRAEAQVRRREAQIEAFRRTEKGGLRDARSLGRLAILYADGESIAAQGRAEAERFRQRAEHHAKLERQYDRAARYPWLSVGPEPPEPR